MNVYQIRIKIYMLKDVPINYIQSKTAAFIDKGFANDEYLLKLHEENCYKGYCFDLPYPTEVEGTYKKGRIYTITVRTVDARLAGYFNEVCVNNFTDEMKGLVSEISILPKKTIQTLYSLTPVILKNDNGYWRRNMRLEDFESRLKINLIKKWNGLHDQKLDENFQLYTLLEFLNKGPVIVHYKDIKLLGDKIRLQIADNQTAQELAYMALGTGMYEMNARGAGFMNYRWL